MRRLYAILYTVLLPCLLFAQAGEGEPTGFSVSGTLLGEGEPVAFANVLLMSASDSSLVEAELSGDDGSFSVTADSGRYFVQVVMLGYDDWQSEALTLSQNLSLGNVQLRAFAKTLATAVVTSKKPFLEQQAGKMIVNVEGSVTGQTGSATQLLRKVPGVVVQQGRVTLAGAAGVTILIDGKPTRYMDVESLLRDLPASDIERVEVVTQPGASYDAEGAGGIVNIILKKNVRLGTNGSVRLGAGRGTYDKLNASLQLSHRDGPLNAYGTAAYRRGSGFERLILDREINGARILQDNLEPYLPNTASLRGGVDYDLGEQHTVGLSGRFATTTDNATGTNTTQAFGGIGFGDAMSAETPLYSLATDNVNDQDRHNYSADAYYRFAIDTAGRQLDVDVSYGAFDRDGELSTVTRVLSGDFTAGIDDIRSQETGATRVAALKADYKHPLTAVLQTTGLQDLTAALNTGALYSTAAIDADLRAQRRPMGTELAFANAPGLTNRFLYDERIAAAYASLDARLGDVSLNAGLRYEHTFLEGENVTSDSSFRRDYGGVFPSFGVSLPLKGSLGASGAYSYRIDRPNYRSLNPFVRFLDPLTVQRGNTGLQPSYVHNAQASLTYDGQPFFRLAYTRTTDAISLVTEQDPLTGVTEGYNANLDTYTSYGGHLFAPLSFIPKTDGYFGGMAYYNEYASDFLGGDFSQGSWAFTGFANATVELPLKLEAELNFWLQSGGQEGILQSGTVYGSSIGLERELLNERLSVGISYEDGLFDPWDGKIRYQDQRFNVINTWETDIVVLNVTYRFGNRYLKSKAQRERAAQGVLDRAE